jgi:PLP dependent protein
MNGKSTLQENYERLQSRLATACQVSGRAPGSVRLLAVSKTFPASDVLALARLGQQAFGENYLQEAVEKIATCRAERPELALEWHFIGPIQSNKTRPIAQQFQWVHSVDRERVARRLSEQRPAALAPLNVCIEVNVSGEASKSGCAPAQLPDLARLVAGLPQLRLRGLMAIPEPASDLPTQNLRFAQVRQLFDSLVAAGIPMDTLSMGMSADAEAAIAQGSTMVRVGTALFGSRGA